MMKRAKCTKALGSILAALIMTGVLTACGPSPAAASSASSDDVFNIRFELGDIADNFTETPLEAKAGDTVEIKTVILHDADIHVYVDGREIEKSHYDSDYWAYSFVMPEKDVLITAKPYTKEEIWGTVEETVKWAEKMSIRTTESISDTMLLNPFDERFMAYLSKHTDGNYMSSPLSFRYALGLLLAGAEGETKTELLHALGVGSEEEWIVHCLDFNGFAESFAAGLEQEIGEFSTAKKEGWLPSDAEEPFRALRVANSVWKTERIAEQFKEGYKESVEKNYAAEYRSFNAMNAVEKINEWADIKTEHMIDKLLPDDYDTSNLAVVLMNALYFKDAWWESFPEALTKEDDFHARDGRTTRKEFMTKEDLFSWYADEETELVIIPMKGGVSMAFVLGSTENLPEKIAKAETARVQVTIPKIDLETDFSNGELIDFLKECGVSLAFDEKKADFSAMIDHQVFVDDIIQKTRLKLDEEGVEAAAVTFIGMDEKGLAVPDEPKVFNADRPFSFYIYATCNETTAMMFAGEIVE